MSVEKVDDDQLEPLKQQAEMESDEEVINAIECCIHLGINTKMLLAEAAAERANVSKRSVLRIIDKYTGDDGGTIHRWYFKVCERGAKVYDSYY